MCLCHQNADIFEVRMNLYGCADSAVISRSRCSVQIRYGPMWSDAVINHTPLGCGNKNSNVICVKAKKLESEMQTIYSMAALCKRPSDIGTKHASRCYPLSPGQTSSAFDIYHREGNIYIHCVPKK